jgi:hypothetical protein
LEAVARHASETCGVFEVTEIVRVVTLGIEAQLTAVAALNEVLVNAG